jgi:pimeloyl-ACP methyl ester carboxylesterase
VKLRIDPDCNASPMWRKICVLMCGTLLACAVPSSGEAADSQAASPYQCAGEQKAFGAFVNAARGNGFDPAYAPAPDSGIQIVRHTVRDGVTLGGYKILARDAAGALAQSKGFILVLLGNAMFAQQVLRPLRTLAAQELDVFVFDYRGYGNSDGIPSIAGITSDTRELLVHLNATEMPPARESKQRFVLAVSAGAAIVALIEDVEELVDRVVFDGAPARVSVNFRAFWIFPVLKLRCPETLDLIASDFSFGPKTLFLQGARDWVLRNTQSKKSQRKLLAQACASGATVVESSALGHPFQDEFTDLRLGGAASYFVTGQLDTAKWPKRSQRCTDIAGTENR